LLYSERGKRDELAWRKRSQWLGARLRKRLDWGGKSKEWQMSSAAKATKIEHGN